MNSIRLNVRLLTNLGDVLLTPVSDIVAATAIANSTWYNIMQHPDGITVQQLLSIANGLHIPVRRFFSSGHSDSVGRREDYIADPYLSCHYDEASLRSFVNSRQSATWKKAAEATGMTYSRLRNSLLGFTRTPVTRFLVVCDVFKIDPFTILIDQNPEKRRNGKKAAAPGGWADDLRTEINTLREDVNRLQETVGDLEEKYSRILKAHESLLNRIQVNIDTVNSSFIGISNDPVVPPKDERQ